MCCQITLKCKDCGAKFKSTLLHDKMYGKYVCGHCVNVSVKKS